MRDQFDLAIRNKLGDSLHVKKEYNDPDETSDISEFIDEVDADEPPQIVEEDPVDINGTPIYEQPFNDMLLQAELLLPQGEEMKPAKVKQ